MLENGGLYVRYKSEAIVVSEEVMHVYDDGEKISCLEIDEKNGILFTGCRSGKVRGHIWPIKDNDTFENYSELRSCFSSVSCLALSNITPLLYIGCSNGNVSKIKYGIDRDKGIDLNKEHNLLMTDRNFRYLSIGTNNIEKMYRFVLSNSTSAITEELPDRMRLEFKLSEVIQKLNF